MRDGVSSRRARLRETLGRLVKLFSDRDADGAAPKAVAYRPPLGEETPNEPVRN